MAYEESPSPHLHGFTDQPDLTSYLIKVKAQDNLLQVGEIILSFYIASKSYILKLLACHHTCDACKGSYVNECVTCQPTLLFLDGFCLEYCDIGYYQLGEVCKRTFLFLTL